jgi:FtsZ-binding cell division protein ZapB
MLESLLIAAIGALVLLLLTSLWDRASRAGQVKNAIDTITILQAQVTTYKEDNTTLRARVESLEASLAALKDMITSAAPIEKLTLKIEAMDSNLTASLVRIEGFVHANQRTRDLDTPNT